jgi:hypothetical protein
MSRAEAELQIALNCPNYYEIHHKFIALQAQHGTDDAIETMSAQERFLVGRYFDSLMVRMDNVCFQYKQGFIPDSYFEHIKVGIRRFAPIWRGFEIEMPPDLEIVIRLVWPEDAEG